GALAALLGTALVAPPAAADPPSGNEFLVRHTLTSGPADVRFAFGRAGDEVLVGDFNGNGRDSFAVRRGNRFYLRHSLASGPADVSFTFGRPGDDVFVGDWNGDGRDTLAVRRGNRFYVRHSLTSGAADLVFTFGRVGDQVFVGDWNGSGTDTMAVRRANRFYVRDTLTTGGADRIFAFGRPGDEVLVGDWNGNGQDTFAVRRGNEVFISYSLVGGSADRSFTFGRAGDTKYVGDFNGNGQSTFAIRRPAPPAPTPPPGHQGAGWPLTGLPAPGGVAQRPALAVKVNNVTTSRPQLGLEYADIVWEQLIEYGSTRFLAVYHSQLPPAILPVRSARPVDISLALPLNGVFVTSGAQDRVLDLLDRSGLHMLTFDRGHPGFHRSQWREAPDNVVGTPSVLLQHAGTGRSVPPPAQFRYAASGAQASAAARGTALSRLEVTMSNRSTTTWHWNAATSTFLRSQGGADSVSNTGARHAATNVVLLEVEIVDRFELPETALDHRSGRAVVATGGRQVAATWSKEGPAAPVVLRDGAGREIELAPGTTWINLVPRPNPIGNRSGAWRVVP
ncbi:MAG: DUF3048 domain-containing protein, partial [Promicromonosporaceae bacterium]|nr:DUF3048 domain-containing protein [Promicromonosporaceae bacterium]